MHEIALYSSDDCYRKISTYLCTYILNLHRKKYYNTRVIRTGLESAISSIISLFITRYFLNSWEQEHYVDVRIIFFLNQTIYLVFYLIYFPLLVCLCSTDYRGCVKECTLVFFSWNQHQVQYSKSSNFRGF